MSDNFLDGLANHEINQMREFALSKAIKSHSVMSHPLTEEQLVQRAERFFKFLTRGRETD